MSQLKDFVKLLSGRFDNSQQVEELRKKGIENYPYAEHVNTPCNDRIKGIPEGFSGIFVLEESYYTVGGRTNAMPHLFLFTEEAGGIRLTSYEIPEGYDKSNFTYKNLSEIPYSSLQVSEKFTPAVYHRKGDVWEGGSESMFTPVLKFKLFERFSNEQLEVSESMEREGKRIFGYDDPILYKRK